MTATLTRYAVVRPLLTPLGLARYELKVWRPEDHPRDPRTGRFIPKPGGPKRRRRPTARNHVVSAGVWETVERARKAIPKDMAGWRAGVVKEVRPAQRQVDRRVDDFKRELAEAQEKLREAEAELEAEFRRKRTPKWKRESIARERLADLRSDVMSAENILAYMQQRAADPNLATSGHDGAFLASMQPAVEVVEYPRDAAGRRLPPDEYNKALDAVLAAGEAIYNEFIDAQQRDKVIYELQQKLDTEYSLAAIKKAVTEDSPDRRRLIDGRPKIRRQMKQREQELLMQLLRSVRGFGNVEHKNAKPLNDINKAQGREYPARMDWRERLREAEKFFPDDWMRLTDDTELTIASSDRAFHRGRRGRNTATIAMSTANRDKDIYSGAFRDATHEVTVHEMGHHMEMHVPGLQELEFTFVRRRAMRGSQLEPVRKLRDVVRHSGYDDHEVSFLDDWADPYTGKTYETTHTTVSGHVMVNDDDPAAKPWEVFQVGLQDTLGRGDRKYGDTELEYFVLGALATLAREEPKPKRTRRKR